MSNPNISILCEWAWRKVDLANKQANPATKPEEVGEAIRAFGRARRAYRKLESDYADYNAELEASGRMKEIELMINPQKQQQLAL